MREKTFYPVFLWSLVIITAFAAFMYLVSGLADADREAKTAQNPTELAALDIDETNTTHYCTVQTEDGQILLETSWPVREGDHFLSRQNQWYQLHLPEGGSPIAMPLENAPDYFHPLPHHPTLTPAASPVVQSGMLAPDGTEREVHVVIYHTHSDESYGYGTNITSEPGNGDVFAVGEQLSTALRALGASVTHSWATHEPHDASAYERSRATLLALLPEQPDLVIDIHRDSAPVEAYVTTINGQLTARVMLVVGAANPNMETNLRYAHAFKEVADAIYPDLVRGIYIGKGCYNQDLYPSAMLMEFGTEGMSQDTAEKAAACVTDVLQTFLTQVLPELVASER